MKRSEEKKRNSLMMPIFFLWRFSGKSPVMAIRILLAGWLAKLPGQAAWQAGWAATSLFITEHPKKKNWLRPLCFSHFAYRTSYFAFRFSLFALRFSQSLAPCRVNIDWVMNNDNASLEKKVLCFYILFHCLSSCLKAGASIWAPEKK